MATWCLHLRRRRSHETDASSDPDRNPQSGTGENATAPPEQVYLPEGGVVGRQSLRLVETIVVNLKLGDVPVPGVRLHLQQIHPRLDQLAREDLSVGVN